MCPVLTSPEGKKHFSLSCKEAPCWFDLLNMVNQSLYATRPTTDSTGAVKSMWNAFLFLYTPSLKFTWLLFHLYKLGLTTGLVLTEVAWSNLVSQGTFSLLQDLFWKKKKKIFRRNAIRNHIALWQCFSLCPSDDAWSKLTMCQWSKLDMILSMI